MGAPSVRLQVDGDLGRWGVDRKWGSDLLIHLQGDVGLIPRICEGLFSRIAGTTRRDAASFRTEVR